MPSQVPPRRKVKAPSFLLPPKNRTVDRPRTIALTASERDRLEPSARPYAKPTSSSAAKAIIFTSEVDQEKAAADLKVKIRKDAASERERKVKAAEKAASEREAARAKDERRKTLFSGFQTGYRGTARPSLQASRPQPNPPTTPSKPAEVLQPPKTMPPKQKATQRKVKDKTYESKKPVSKPTTVRRGNRLREPAQAALSVPDASFVESSSPPAPAIQDDLEAQLEHAFTASDELMPSSTPTLAAEASIAPALATPLEKYLANISEDVRDVSDYLRTQAASGKMPTSLPDLTADDDTADEGERDVPWSAKQLIKLYILSFHAKDYHTCDLVIDTWIRAFQKVQDEGRILWQPNKSHKKDKDDKDDEKMANVGANPSLEEHVTAFDPGLLHDLYTYTAPRSGARVLWADNIALCGKNIEVAMDKYKDKWHPDLVFDVMQTALRLVRARLTLKIEEKTPKEWCDRYHEHGKRGLDCYRDIVQEQQLGAYELKKSRKRTRDEDEVPSPSKKAKVGGGDDSSEEDD
ncbi:hypothetical protein BDV96DRAFT_566285 [Lophiotrema nucula]|uniref:Uncharacterized protein n=1 Tax=Lophiotrema nucula TaxID=690887 RepID=A0A6A5ZM43_9PLEO|nr:hypothetical protein BDV96DRAFT_566285 [Lophiotrema nucula]